MLAVIYVFSSCFFTWEQLFSFHTVFWERLNQHLYFVWCTASFPIFVVVSHSLMESLYQGITIIPGWGWGAVREEDLLEFVLYNQCLPHSPPHTQQINRGRKENIKKRRPKTDVFNLIRIIFFNSYRKCALECFKRIVCLSFCGSHCILSSYISPPLNFVRFWNENCFL